MEVKMRKLAIILAFSMMIPVTAVAERGQRGPSGQSMIKELNLSSEQMDKMRSVRKEMYRHRIKTKSELDLKRVDFHDELQNEKPNSAKLDKLIKEIAEIEAEMATHRLRSQVKISQILTPEQKKKMQERMGGSFIGEGRRGNERSRPGKHYGGSSYR
tara:strand:- start:121587 stop:122060 length:474 start_codon:yes stop_codon:yes gene_type:complete